MQRATYSLLLLFALLLAGCDSGSNSDDTVDSSPLVGNWVSEFETPRSWEAYTGRNRGTARIQVSLRTSGNDDHSVTGSATFFEPGFSTDYEVSGSRTSSGVALTFDSEEDVQIEEFTFTGRLNESGERLNGDFDFQDGLLVNSIFLGRQ